MSPGAFALMADSRSKLTLRVAAEGRKRAASLTEHERKDAWMRSEEGTREWRECRAKAQAYADATGSDAGIELLWNGGFPGMRMWSWFGLPAKPYRYGHETTCEVVHPTDISKCALGRGPLANRPPSPTGPDYHGGPWPGREVALEVNRVWWAEWHRLKNRG